jgi:hypothetical protein
MAGLMNKDQEFRRLAAEAQVLADKAKNAADRAAWLRIAGGWLGLIQGRKPTPDQHLHVTSAKLGTKQEAATTSR